MKPVKHAEEFLDLISDLGGGESKPMLFNEIKKELDSTYNHIQQ